tara:strand:- start:185 stop:400 length:216 start_codon:yes stop_codon:yes gene_type:complete
MEAWVISHYLKVEGKVMNPWIIEKVKEEERRRQHRPCVQPQLPPPQPYQHEQKKSDNPDRGSSIVDFEIKI